MDIANTDILLGCFMQDTHKKYIPDSCFLAGIRYIIVEQSWRIKMKQPTIQEQEAVRGACKNGHGMAPFTPTGRGKEVISRCRMCGADVILDPETNRINGYAKVMECHQPRLMR